MATPSFLHPHLKAKKCSTCRECLPFDHFTKGNGTGNVRGVCKGCRKKQSQKRAEDRFFRLCLENYSITREAIERGDWKYAGGNHNSHLKYWKLHTDDEELPEWVDKCVCGHAIIENCYIENITDPHDIKLIVLGNCCIKKFLPKEYSSRTCKECGDPHKNRVVDLCNYCRMRRPCRDCGEIIHPTFFRCKPCHYKFKNWN